MLLTKEGETSYKKSYFPQWNTLRMKLETLVDNNEVYFDIVAEQSFDQTHDDKTDEKVNIVTEANTETLTSCNCSRQLLEYENKIESLEEQLNLPLY